MYSWVSSQPEELHISTRDFQFCLLWTHRKKMLQVNKSTSVSLSPTDAALSSTKVDCSHHLPLSLFFRLHKLHTLISLSCTLNSATPSFTVSCSLPNTLSSSLLTKFQSYDLPRHLPQDLILGFSSSIKSPQSTT